MTQSDSFTFRRWAAASATRRDDVGDLCRAIATDRDFPKDDPGARRYLAAKFAGGDAIWATKTVSSTARRFGAACRRGLARRGWTPSWKTW